MTNTVRWYERQRSGWLNTATLAIGSAALATGICYDGHAYWITDQTSDTVECWILEAGAFYQVASLSLPSPYKDPWGVATDGMDLWVGVLYDVAGPPISNYTVLVKMDKRGNVLCERDRRDANIYTDEELDWNGQHLLRSYTINSAPLQYRADQVVPDLGKPLIGAAQGRRIEAMTTDLNHLAEVVEVAGTHRGITYDHQAHAVSLLSVLGVEAYSATFVGHQLAAIFRA
ncbi:MAG TPA: hypothetical protein VFD43_01850 [Planctomycetota bacterium]|nr:hypothetical protein [Planctomycetota bacterium]